MRVLIVRVGAMGDVLHALPAAMALRRARPGWTIDWVVDERWRTLLGEQDGPVVNRTYTVAIQSWKAKPFSLATLKALWAFRKLRGQYDVVVDMQGTMRSALIAWIAGSGKVAGYADPRESFATTFYARKLTRRGTHVVQQGAALLGEAVGVEFAPAPDVALAREPWAEAWADHEAVLKRPLAVLAAGAGWAAKEWPIARFGELAVLLTTKGYDVVVNAPRSDNPHSLGVVAASNGAARMVVCNVAGLTALLRRTDLFVGGDSGPTHLAAALAVPLVALFGPTLPERNGPWGPGIKRVLRTPGSLTSYKHSSEVHAGLQKLSVAAVMDAVNEVV